MTRDENSLIVTIGCLFITDMKGTVNEGLPHRHAVSKQVRMSEHSPLFPSRL